MRVILGALTCVLLSASSASASTQIFHRVLEFNFIHDDPRDGSHFDGTFYGYWHPTGHVFIPSFSASLGNLTGVEIVTRNFTRTQLTWDLTTESEHYLRSVGINIFEGDADIFPAGGDSTHIFEGTNGFYYGRELYSGDVGEYDSGLVSLGEGTRNIVDYGVDRSLLDSIQTPGYSDISISPWANIVIEECLGQTIPCGPVTLHIQYIDDIVLTYSYTPTVPEPAAWSLMILGFGLLGGVLRVRDFRVA